MLTVKYIRPIYASKLYLLCRWINKQKWIIHEQTINLKLHKNSKRQQKNFTECYWSSAKVRLNTRTLPAEAEQNVQPNPSAEDWLRPNFGPSLQSIVHYILVCQQETVNMYRIFYCCLLCSSAGLTYARQYRIHDKLTMISAFCKGSIRHKTFNIPFHEDLYCNQLSSVLELSCTMGLGYHIPNPCASDHVHGQLL